MFCARTLIHSTWRCHSGGAFDVALSGGARSAPRKEEYVTSIDFRMVKSATRLSAKELLGWDRKLIKLKPDNKQTRTCSSILWVQLMNAHLSKRGDCLFELVGASHTPLATEYWARRTNHVSPNTSKYPSSRIQSTRGFSNEVSDHSGTSF